ncbi:MAG TPA: phage portal protein, partial [Thermoplasmata archaeon]|nr:phage portal protein [Thermoplasmata archaeon]
MTNPLAKIKSFFGAEGSYKTPGYGVTTFGNWFPIGFGDGFERDINLQGKGRNGMNTTVEACVSTISQTVAMLPIKHVKIDADGGRTEIKTSAAYRVLKKPNPFQTKSEFMVDIIRRMLLTGNGMGVCTRNKRYEIKHIYPQYQLEPYVSHDQCDVYYQGFTDELCQFSLERMLPSRDVLHLKMHTTSHPLVGETPLTAAMVSASTGNSIQGHTNAFFRNMSRPSGVLQTEMTLKPEQTQELRKRFEEMSKNNESGGLPILTNGLKYQAITMNAVDSEIIATYNMTKSDIASVFRVPLALIGDMEKATFANTESLMKFWVSSGLGFIIEHLEASFEDLFDLPNDEAIEFDTEFLLQADFKGRIDGYKSGVQGGIFTPNEARKKEGLKAKKGGDDLLVQMQMVALEDNKKKIGLEISLLENPPEPTDGVVNDTAPEAAKMMLKGYANEV